MVVFSLPVVNKCVIIYFCLRWHTYRTSANVWEEELVHMQLRQSQMLDGPDHSRMYFHLYILHRVIWKTNTYSKFLSTSV